MIIAEQKKKENIVEYIIYLRQIQDLIRACNFDMKKIKEHLVQKYEVEDAIRLKIEKWYYSITKEMLDKNLYQSGDIDEIKQKIAELESLHQKLLNNTDEYKHKELYSWAEPNLKIFREISNSKDKSDIEICFDALYSLLLLRLKKQPISDETMGAMQTYSNLLIYLARKYHGLE